MSIISEYYANYSGIDYLPEVAPFIFDAIRYILDESHRYNEELYAVAKGRLALETPMPPDFSRMPGVELGFEPVYTRVYAVPKRKKSAVTGIEPKDILLPYCDDVRGVKGTDVLTAKEITALKSQGLCERYIEQEPRVLGALTNEARTLKYNEAICCRGTSPLGRGVPILCNLALGEMYYIFDQFLHERWSSGSLYLRRSVREYPGGLQGWPPSPVMCVNWITGETSILGCRVTLPPPVKPVRYAEYAKGKQMWAMPWQGEGLSAGYGTLGDIEVCLTQEVKGPRPNYTLLPCNTVNTLSFLETLHELPIGSLTAPACLDALDPENALFVGMDRFLCLVQYFGNLFQGVLQTTAISSWFLRNLLVTLKPGSKPIGGGHKSVPSWLELNKLDYKYFLSRPDEQELMFFKLLNQLKPTSFHEFQRIWEQVLVANGTWLDEYTPEHRRFERIMVRGQHRKILFSSSRLPYFMYKYTKHGLQTSIPVYKYLKYIISEGKATFDPVTKTSATLGQLEAWLYDYNRTARKIIPNIPFTLPYHLKKAHDTMVENYNRIIEDRRTASSEGDSLEDNELLAFSSCYLDKDPSVVEDTKYCVLAPASNLDLYEEGILLNHCVTSYGQEIIAARGSMLIFFLREKARQAHPLITIQVDRIKDEYYLTEVAGKGNRLPTAQEQAFCDGWLIAFNAAYKAAKKTPKKRSALAYRADVVDWLTLLGCIPSAMPPFHSERSQEENYLELFSSTIPSAISMAKANESLSPSLLMSIKSQLATFSSSLRLNSATAKEILSLTNHETSAA